MPPARLFTDSPPRNRVLLPFCKGFPPLLSRGRGGMKLSSCPFALQKSNVCTCETLSMGLRLSFML